MSATAVTAVEVDASGSVWYTFGMKSNDRSERSMSFLSHVHSAACLAGNELDENCCAEADGAYLQNCAGLDVTMPNGVIVPVFAEGDDDARALAALATGEPCPADAPVALSTRKDPFAGDDCELRCMNDRCPEIDVDRNDNGSANVLRHHWEGQGFEGSDGSFEVTVNKTCRHCGATGEVV